MADPAKFEQFLEPVYLNEKMVLNCAAYLMKGVPVEFEGGDTKDSSKSAAVALGVPFIGEVLGSPKLEGGFKSGSHQESKTVRRYTSGGLHMMVLDTLRDKKMIHSHSADRLPQSLRMGEGYVDVHAFLRPSDYYSLIGTLKILGPLVAQISRDFGDRFLQANGNNSYDNSALRDSVDKYEQSIMSLIDKLERDYLTSKPLEMVMWSKDGNGVPVGIVDLDVTDYEPNELRARLSGGKYHIIGKVVGKVEQGKPLNLMQKTIMFNTVELVQKLMATQSNKEKIEEFRVQAAGIRKTVETFVRLEIPGPAVRIVAMSVCI